MTKINEFTTEELLSMMNIISIKEQFDHGVIIRNIKGQEEKYIKRCDQIWEKK